MIILNSLKIDNIIKSKRKTLKIEIDDHSIITLRVPLTASNAEITQFIIQNMRWIHKTLDKVDKKEKFVRKYEDDELFLFLGRNYKLSIREYTNFTFKFDGNRFIIARKALPQAKILFENFYKHRANAIIPHRVYDIAIKLNIKFRNLKITSARGRWGSCNQNGNINFSWRLIMADTRVIDYVIIHELSHLFEMNHSPKFWALVAKIMPDYHLQKKWLDENTKFMIL
jgi:predicted metal-dependent hydrolase